MCKSRVFSRLREHIPIAVRLKTGKSSSNGACYTRQDTRYSVKAVHSTSVVHLELVTDEWLKEKTTVHF